MKVTLDVKEASDLLIAKLKEDGVIPYEATVNINVNTSLVKFVDVKEYVAQDLVTFTFRKYDE